MYSIRRHSSRLLSFSVSLKSFGRKLYDDFFNNSRIIFEQRKQVSFFTHENTLCSSNNKRRIVLPTMSTSTTTTTTNQFIYLTALNAKKYLDNYDTILLDCDGVLWGTDGTTSIGNVGKALKKLRDFYGKQLLFVTNNSLYCTETFLDKFNFFGYTDVREDELFCVSTASALYLKEVLKIKGSVYIIGTRAMDKELRSAGVDCFGVGPDPDPVTRDMAELLKANFRDDVEAVLVGFDEHLNYNKLYKAASYIRRSLQDNTTTRCHYLATSNVEIGIWIGTGRYCPTTGVIVNSVTAACGQEPGIIGKPSPFLYDCILSRFPNLKKERTIMIGDSLKSDVTFAQNIGIDSALVLSGATDLKTLSCVSNQKKPTFYLESIGIFAEAS